MGINKRTKLSIFSLIILGTTGIFILGLNYLVGRISNISDSKINSPQKSFDTKITQKNLEDFNNPIPDKKIDFEQYMPPEPKMQQPSFAEPRNYSNPNLRRNPPAMPSRNTNKFRPPNPRDYSNVRNSPPRMDYKNNAQEQPAYYNPPAGYYPPNQYWPEEEAEDYPPQDYYYYPPEYYYPEDYEGKNSIEEDIKLTEHEEYYFDEGDADVDGDIDEEYFYDD